MTTRRQYNLPFCTLILDGLTENDRSAVMTTLMNAECHFMGSQEVLQGGKVFLESLVQAVSDHAQACLSGLARPGRDQTQESPLVSLVFLADRQTHQLHFAGRPERQEPQVTLELTPVQFFDLLEAVDQLLGDPGVRLGLNLRLQPLDRRYRYGEETVAQRLMGPALGVGSLALVGAIAWYLPIPSKTKVEPKPPTATQPKETPPPVTPPSETKPTPPRDTSTPPPQGESKPLADNLYRDLLAKSSLESDPTAIGYMQQYLYRNLDRAWTQRRTFPREATYRVLVGRDGSLLGYRPLDDRAEAVLAATPLEKLSYTPIDPLKPPQEAIAQFKVVFKPGIFQVSPWDGYRGIPQWGSQQVNKGTIQPQIDQLQARLASTWQGDKTLREPLVFRVGITAAGEIGDYVASNAAGVIHDQKTPLNQWVKPEAAGIAIGKSVVPTVPLTYVRVSLNPDGSVMVKPW